MKSIGGVSGPSKSQGPSGVDLTTDGSPAGSPAPSSVDGLPVPPYSVAPGDDAMTALAVLQIKMMHEDRDMANNEQQAAQKAADEAHDQKIEDMHKQANDTLMSGVMGGVFGGLSAAASGASAINNFEASLGGPKADVEKLKGGLGEACSKGFDAAGKFASSIFDAKKLDDKADEESADKDLDHAKSASDAASSRAKQDQDDIQTTINALRGITQSKAAIEQGTIIRA